jgi:hypothetical protein
MGATDIEGLIGSGSSPICINMFEAVAPFA